MSATPTHRRSVGCGPGAPEAGFSLVEVLVALVVAVVGLTLAAGILVETHRMLAQAGLELRAPAAEDALDLLRAELQGAAGVTGGPPGGLGWSRDRLVLVRPDGATVVYERDGRRLVRRVAGGGRTAVPDLVSWRWRQDAARLVTVEVVYEGRRGPGGVVVSPRGRTGGASEWRTRRLTAALRGGGARRGW